MRVESLESRQLLAAVALPDTFGVIENSLLNVSASGVLANDLVASGNPLTITNNSTPANGSLVLNPNGTFTYTPNANFTGQDTFNYTVTDGQNNFAASVVTLNVAASVPVASVSAGTRLANVDTTQSALLNALLGNLVGGASLSTSVVDNNALASGQIQGGALLNALQTNLGLATPDQALAANVTLPELLSAAADAAQAEGNTALVTAFDNVALQLTGSTQTIRLGDLVNVTPNQGDFADASLNALDLVTGGVQLFNFQNVAATTTPVTISGSAIGLGSVVNNVALSALVVEPPIFTVGGVGTTFQTAGIRLKMNLDLVDLTPNTTGLNTVLAGVLGGPLSNLLTVNSNLTVGNIDLFTTVASGTGTITAINAISRAVTMQTTPGVANAYLGTISDSVFGNRAVAINPATDVGFGTIGSLTIGTTGLITTGGTTAIQARSSALGSAPLSGTLVFNPPYPETLVDGNSAAFLANLVSTLTTNLQVQTSGTLGLILDPLVNGTILPVVKPLVANALSPVLSSVLSGVADPALDALGIGIGQLIVTVNNEGLVAPPAANPDVAVTNRNTTVTIPVLANDASVAGDTITITGLTQPTNGTVVLNPNGTVTYNPAANFVGVDTFTYTITGNNGSSTATVTVNVNAPNDPPIAVADNYAVVQNTTLTIAAPGVLANDSDPQGTPLTAVLVSGPTNGTLTLNANGSFTYTPTLNFVGTDSYIYQASDGVNLSNPVSVTITVAASITAPVALPDAYTGPQDVPLTIVAPGVLANDVSPGNLPLTAVVVTGPANGTLALNGDGSFVYTPNAGFVGTDTFTYFATNGTTPSAAVGVTISVTAVNNNPVALPDAYSGLQDTPVVIAAPGVLANDSDPNGDPLTAVLVTGPANGTLTLNANGSFVYTPNAGFVGTDSFIYRASDGTNLSAPVSVSITLAAANNTPVAAPDTYTVTSGTVLTVATPGVLGNDFDPNGDPLTTVLVTGPANGTLTLNPNGSFTYTPNAGFVGADGFTYRASDGTNLSNVAAVTINVATANQSPVALPDVYTGTQNVPLTIAAPGVLANDSDPEGSPLTAVLVTGPTNGTLTLNPNGSFTYVPNTGFLGTDSFIYRASDGVNLSNPIAVSLVIAAAASGPVAVPDTYTVNAGTPLTIPGPGVLANDNSPSGAPLTAILVSGPTRGSLTLNPNGSFTYTPNAGFVGSDIFSYRASDGTNLSAPVNVTIAVTAVNGAPVALPDIYTGTQGTPLVIPGPGVLGNDFDPNGDPLTAVLVTGPTNGTLTLNPNGSFVFIPNPGFVGSDSFVYRASDGRALSVPITVSLNILPASVGPVAPRGVSVARFGFHAQPTSFFIQFNTDLDPTSASDVNNYVLVDAGRDKRVGTRDDRRIAIRSAVYDPSTRVVTLFPVGRIALIGNYQLTLRGTGANPLRGTTGLAIDGNGDGVVGDDQLIQITQFTLAGKANTPQTQRQALARQITLTQLSPPNGRLFSARGRLYQALRRQF